MKVRWAGSRKCVLRCLLFAVIAAVGWGATAAAQPVAIVTDTRGKAVLDSDPRKPDLAITAALDPAARVQLGPDARLVVLYLKSGDEFALTGPALIEFNADEPKALKGAAPVKRTSALARAGGEVRIKPAGVAQAALVMRSIRPAARIRVLTLTGTKTLDESPVFRWEAVQQGVSYQFELSDDTGKVLHEATTPATEVRLPAAILLREATPYSWSVSARLDDGRRYASNSDFSIVMPRVRAQVEAARPAANAAFSERVAYALWLDQLELLDEARKYWMALAAERPEDSQLQARARK